MAALDIMTFLRFNGIMTETMGVAETKRRFAELIDRVVAGERIIVTRRGRPVIALVPATDDAAAEPRTYVGLAAFAGILEDWDEGPEMIEEILAARHRSFGREVPEID